MSRSVIAAVPDPPAPVCAGRSAGAPPRWLPWAFLAFGAVVVAGQQAFAGTGARLPLSLACRVLAGGAVLLGVHLHKPERAGPWLLVVLGSACASAGDTVWVLGDVTGFTPPVPLSGLTYVVGYALFGLAIVTMDGRGLNRRDAALDGAVIGVATVSLLWMMFLQPGFPRSGDAWFQTAVSLFPVADLILLSLLLHRGARRRSPGRSMDLLTLALVAVLVGDVAFLVATQMTGELHATGFDATWLAGSILLGTAALHPSMVAVTSAAPEPRPNFGRPDEGPAGGGVVRVGALGLALAAPAGVALARGAELDNPTLLLAGSAQLLLVVLVTVRLGRLMAVVRRQLREAQELQTTLAHQATHDALTGLPNRQLFAEELRSALSRRSGEAPYVAVLFIGLDQLKAVNDTLGHEAGDRVLRSVARRISHVVRGGDVVARFGGDEFVVLLAGVESPAQARSVAERLADEVREPLMVNGEPVVVTTTIGVTVSAPDDAVVTPERLLHDADAALLDGKRRGRDLVVPFEGAMRSHLAGWLQTENELRAALERGEFRLYYQPEIDLAARRLFGVEALIRWEHPVRGMVPPGEFLGVAESSGLIMPIGRWVIEEACAQARRWRDRYGSGAPPVSINVSPLQLAREDVCAQVERALHGNGLDATAVRVEVTETALLADEVHASAQVRGLRALGVEVAVDDFGTGFFSLSHLKDLRVDVIKIDRSFVAGIGTNRTDDAIIHSVIELARRLGVRTVAEGVETTEQLERLVAAGCDVAQGFLYARPLPPAELEARLDDGTFRHSDAVSPR
jgi:diguanylate cyclase (GGDEF)-like protein